MSHYQYEGDSRFRKPRPDLLNSGKFKPGELVQYVERFRKKGHTEKYRVHTCTADAMTFLGHTVKGKNFDPECFERVG